jgi:hypothetical protein
MATNSKNAGVFIGPAGCYIKKTRHNRDQLIPVPEIDQFSTRGELQETSQLVPNHKRSQKPVFRRVPVVS